MLISLNADVPRLFPDLCEAPELPFQAPFYFQSEPIATYFVVT